MLQIVRKMHDAGVGLLAGSDTGWGNDYTFAGFSLHDELALLVQAGLAPVDALRAATVDATTFLSLQDEMGAVEEGKVADLVLLEANPLADIANTRSIVAVVVNGRYLPKENLQKLLTDVEAMAGED